MTLTYRKIPGNGIPQQYILDLAGLMAKFNNENSLSYLEVGAFDGIQYSNTLFLRNKLGWSGLLVEPVKEYYDLLCQNRPDDVCVNAILLSGDNEELLRIRKSGPMSQVISNGNNKISFLKGVRSLLRKMLSGILGLSVGRVEVVRATTVNQLCLDHKIKKLHFISCDVEGMEHEVLKGIDYSMLDVLAILVEVRPSNIMPILEQLLPLGFVCTEAMSRFNKKDNPRWDGTHQDYLFLRRDFVAWAEHNTN